LRIEVRSPARIAAPAAGCATITEYGTEVVRLEQTLDEQPFQAANVIPAMELTKREAPRELHGEGQDWGKAHHHPMRWLVAAGASAAVLLVAALAGQKLYLTTQKNPRAVHLELVDEVMPEEVKGFEIDGACEASARSMVAAYAKARTPAEVLPLLREAARLTPRLTRDWQPWQAPADWQPAREAVWSVTAEGGRGHGTLRGRKPDFTPFQVCFIREGDALRIDWEATEGLGDTDFATLQKGRGTGGIIRAYVAPESFYSLTFPETEYHSYKVLAPDREQVVWGYAKAGSAAAVALLKVFEAAAQGDEANVGQPIAQRQVSGAEQAMSLRLSPAPEGAQKNQWLIGEMLHIDWVSP